MRKIVKYILIPFAVILTASYFQFYSDISINIGDSEWWISHHKYYISNAESKDVYIITKNKWFITYDRYDAKKGDTINITINDNTDFILSLYSHEENMGFNWRIQNALNPKILQFAGDSYMKPSALKIEPAYSTGGSTRRQNLYLKTLNKGSENIEMKYIYEGDVEKIKAAGNYDNVINQQFEFRLNVQVK